MALTITSGVLQPWTAIAQNAIGESAALDITGHYMTTLIIQAALDTETAHASGTAFRPQISHHATGDEDWADWPGLFSGLVGTANSEAITNNPLAAAATTITCASTTGYTVLGEWRFIKDGTLANSELILQVAVTTNTNITILDGVANEHAQNTLMYNIALSQPVVVPMGAGLRLRVVVDNTKTAAGSTVCYKVLYTKTTGV